MDEERVKTLKNSSILEKYKNDKDKIGWGVIFSKTSNTYQIYLPSDDYYMEIGSCRRGQTPEKKNAGIIFDVASNPKKSDELRKKLMDVAVEKLRNDIYSINSVLNTLNKEKGLNNNNVSLKDFIDILEKEE